MQTITIDILNSKVIKLLHDLEQLQLIRVHVLEIQTASKLPLKYKGAMTKQSLVEIDEQLKELRNEWD